MKINFIKGACNVSLLTLSLASTAFATEKPTLKEGKWRGEFQVNETRVPFNFEIKGKSLESSTLTLLNGSRRDDFKVKAISGDSIFVK